MISKRWINVSAMLGASIAASELTASLMTGWSMQTIASIVVGTVIVVASGVAMFKSFNHK